MLCETKSKLVLTQSTIPSDSTRLFQNGQLENSGPQIWTTWLDNKDCPTAIKLYKNGITEIKMLDPPSARSLPFCYQLTFKAVSSNMTIEFTKEEQTISYKLKEYSQFLAWRSILRNKINQEDFHNYYKPIQKLGTGTFAVVFSALKYEDNKIYAVKSLSKQATFSGVKGKETVKKELQVMRTLDQKNLMKLYQVFQSETSLFLVFELLQGPSLETKIEEEYKFKPQQVKSIMKGLLEGVNAMHMKEIMHRDLKPDNVIFRFPESETSIKNSRGQLVYWVDEVVIADFGLAEFVNSPSYLYTRCGTPGYVAPQIINIIDLGNTRYGQACDLYSLGLIFHILLMGKSLFNGNSYDEVLRKNRHYEYTFNGKDYADLPKEAVDLMQKLLIKNPVKRITAAEALKHPYITGAQPSTVSKLKRIWSLVAFQKFEQEQPTKSNAENLKEAEKKEEKLPNFIGSEPVFKFKFKFDEHEDELDQSIVLQQNNTQSQKNKIDKGEVEIKEAPPQPSNRKNYWDSLKRYI